MIKHVQDGALKIDPRFDHRVAILEKDGIYATIALSEWTVPGIYILGRSDPRHGITHSTQTDGRDAALKAFGNSIRTSIEAGWRVAWSGLPFGHPEAKANG